VPHFDREVRMMASFVVMVTLSERFKQAYLKAIGDAKAGGIFKLPDDIEESRESHNKFLEKLKAEGKLFCAGPFDDFEGALLVFENTSREEIRQILEQEPHTRNGFFAEWEAREWHHRF
jgi:uncharacterized protein YciI